MDTETAIETRIKPQLVESFGDQVANSLLTLATIAYVTAQGDEKHKYRAFVRSICSDERVLSQWDNETITRQRKQWEALATASSGQI